MILRTNSINWLAFIMIKDWVLYEVCLFVFCATAPSGARASSLSRFLHHTQRRTTVGRTPLDEWSARRRDLYLTTHNTHNRQTSMPPVGIEPTISAGERPQTHALDRTATGTGCLWRRNRNFIYNLDELAFLKVFNAIVFLYKILRLCDIRLPPCSTREMCSSGQLRSV